IAAHPRRLRSDFRFFIHAYRFDVVPGRFFNSLLMPGTLVKQQFKDPVQLDLFTPHQFGYEFLTNKRLGARKVLA
ncbi:MAG: hypothetical protein MN733_11660, partial [Nitrososphaera sp.]|nr:hypothetical protein [Nitrososphaera sp.]